MASGKQILLFVLQELSQRSHSDNDLVEASDRVKSALCAHCSTSGETMEQIKNIAWLSETDKDGLIKQGLGISKSEVFLSDIFAELIIDEKIPDRIRNRFPKLTQDEYTTSLDMIWNLFSAIQYWEQLSSVENEGILNINEIENSLKSYSKWIKSYDKEPW